MTFPDLSFIKSETPGMLETVLMNRDGHITLSSVPVIYSLVRTEKFKMIFKLILLYT